MFVEVPAVNCDESVIVERPAFAKTEGKVGSQMYVDVYPSLFGLVAPRNRIGSLSSFLATRGTGRTK